MKVSNLLQRIIGTESEESRLSHDAIWVRETRETASDLPPLRTDEIICAKIESHSGTLDVSIDIDSVIDALLMEL